MRLRAAVALITGIVLIVPVPAGALPKGTKVQTYQGGLNFPIDMSWVKGTKKIFFTERGGKIRVMRGRKLLKRPCINLGVRSDGERGLLGLALHPNFKKNHFLYAFFTDASPLQNRVNRYKVTKNRCKHNKTIVDGLDASSGYHNGGQIEFMNGKLFISTGEGHSAGVAQSTSNRLGKILRVNPGGSIPGNNPFGNAVWSYGHRNPFGLAYRPGTDLLYETENGPSCDDELNLIRKGRNYGWGDGYSCGTRGVGSDPKGPMRRYSNIIVPTDLWWYSGRLDALDNHLLMGDYNGNLHSFKMRRNGTRVKKERTIYSTGGILDVAKGPGGWPYFMTSSGMFRIVKK